ncbi:MAG: hypothetical protein CSA72_13440 [Rhodobacterales bacterium]|nr:MAG: hypothetical protein CSA72_13440 [Rhodobacterales bacterium]
MTKRIFIVGTPRSGTTFLQSLLACSPDVVSFPETHFFDRTVRNVLGFPIVYRSASAIVAEFRRDTEGLSIPYPELDEANGLGALHARGPVKHAKKLIAYLDAMAQNIGGEMWIEKTPRHLDHIGVIKAACGPCEPQFVHILRKRSSNVRSLVAAAPQWGQTMSERDAARQWRDDVLVHGSFASEENHHFIFYEDLTNAPEASVRDLAEALGVTLTSDMLASRGEVARSMVNGWEKWKVNNLDSRILARDETIWEDDYEQVVVDALLKIETVKVGPRSAEP